MTQPPLSRILYVEDDHDIQTIAQIALEAVGGFTLRTCNSGLEALAPDSVAFAPQLLLLDVMMPGMDGPTTLAQLRQLPGLATTPVIFMTAKVQANEVADYMALGALGVIAKPFDPIGLSGQVRTLWEARSA